MTVLLEKRITAALDDDHITAADLATLLTEAEVAVVTAEENAQLERERALDPIRSPDPAKARAAMEDADFAANRLRTLLPRLQQRWERVLEAEEWQAWRADFEALEIERDALAQELSELYPAFAQKAVDLFTRMTAHEQAVSHLHSRRAAGVRDHLLSPELVARGLQSFSPDQPSLVRNVQLPAWDSTQAKWPPPQKSMAAALIENPVPVPYHPGADWWREIEARNAARREEAEQVAAYYEQQARNRPKPG